MAKRPIGNPTEKGNDMRLDPLIKSLLGHLPAPKSVWPPQERQHWIQMLQNAFQVVYKDAPDPKGAPGAATPPGRSV